MHKVNTLSREFLVAVVQTFDKCRNKAETGRELGCDEATIRRALARARRAGIHPTPPPPTKYEGQLVVVAQGDLHDAPDVPSARFKWLGRYVAEIQPDIFYDIGDSITLNSCAAMVPNETVAGKLKPSFMEDMASAHEAWNVFDAECPVDGGPERRKTRGNHEHRLYKFEDRTPEVAGMMQFEYQRVLDRHGFTETEYGEISFCGGVGFVHVPLNIMGRPYGGKNVEPRVANDALFDIVFGHSHRKNHFRSAKIGNNQHINVVNLGCGLPEGYVEDYAKMATTGWWWGTHKLTIQDGHIQSVEAVTMKELERRYG